MMTDTTKTRLSLFLYASMFVFPGAALAVGWVAWDFRTGFVAAMFTFAVCFVLAGLLLATVKDLSWIAVGLPFSLGVVWAALPDFLGPLDDAVMISAGALITFALTWFARSMLERAWASKLVKSPKFSAAVMNTEKNSSPPITISAMPM